jgi:hypothetical protein
MGEDDKRKEKEIRIIDFRTTFAECSEGGYEADLTPPGTVVSMTAFKNIYLGLTAGESLKFPAIRGSDLSGQTWTGSYAMLADGPKWFHGQNLTRSREVVTLQIAGGIPSISISTKYFQVSDGGIYQIVFSSGVTYVPLSQAPLPSLPKVGDCGTLGTFAGSDTSTVTVTWQLKPGFLGSSVLEVSSVMTREDNNESATEVDCYLLDSSGIPRTVSLCATGIDTTVSVSGNRADDNKDKKKD